MEPETVAILGAGLSGLSCAQTLQHAGVPVRIFERENRVGGRCTTRLWQGHLVDDGIQYFTAQTPDFKRELIARLRQFRPIVAPIHDPAGQMVVSPGGPRFYVLQGNNYFAQVLSHGLRIALDTPVETIEFSEQGVEILGETYRAVVSSLPPAQTVALFGRGRAPDDFPPCISALLEYSGLDAIDPAPIYGRVSSDEACPISASYCENHKSARIIGPKTVFVVRTSAKFSDRHPAEPQENYLAEIIRANDEMWGIPSGRCTASFVYRWPLRIRSVSDFQPPPGAFICGDGQAALTIEDAWHDGRFAAREVLGFLGKPTTPA